MINLLSPNDQHQLAASRTNSLILRYIFLTSVVIALMTLEMLGVYFFISSEKARNETTIAENSQKASSYASIQAQAESFRSNLVISKYILDKQIPYTSIILAIAQALPSEVTLDSLALDPSTFGNPTTITVQTNSAAKAVDIKTKLQEAQYKSRPLFSNVNFVSIAATDSGSSYTATFNVSYSKEILTL